MSTQTDEINTSAELDFEAPLQAAARGKLAVISGVPRLSLDRDAAMSQLVRAHFERPLSDVKVRGGVSGFDADLSQVHFTDLYLQGGVSSLTSDGQHYGPLRNLPRLESPGFAQAANRYDIQITGGVRSAVVGI